MPSLHASSCRGIIPISICCRSLTSVAAFYGTPLIATRCGGPEEIIADNKTGILVANKDVNEMANAILKLAANTELRNYYALAGKKYVRDKFSTEQFAKSFEKILRE